jgi:hypothetical protein
VTLPTAVLVPRALAGRAGAPSREPSIAQAIESRPPVPAQRPPYAPPLALESSSSRMFEAPPPPPVTPPPMVTPPMVTPPPLPPITPPAHTPSRAGMPAWSDLTGANADSPVNGDPLPRRPVTPSTDDSGYYGAQVPRQTPPPPSTTPISAVPVSAVPVSSPPAPPPPAAPPVWPPVAGDVPPQRPVRSESPTVVPQHIPYADETMELPIFRELESAWFNTRRGAAEDSAPTTPAYPAPDLTITAQFATVDTNGNGGGPRAGSYGDVPTSTPKKDEMVTAQAGWGSTARPAAAAAAETVPAAYRPSWQTAADDGWAAATAAAHVEHSETTQAGLPRRTPMAQLVPGGVEKAAPNVQRRSPEGVRGLLSAYHRGVQRGRTQHKDDDVNPGSTEAGGQSGKEHEA